MKTKERTLSCCSQQSCLGKAEQCAHILFRTGEVEVRNARCPHQNNIRIEHTCKRMSREGREGYSSTLYFCTPKKRAPLLPHELDQVLLEMTSQYLRSGRGL